MRLLRFVLLFAGLPPAWSAPRVALHVEAPADAAAWQAALTAEFTRLAPDAELVERAELARLWREREQTATGDAAFATPAPLGVDRYLNFRRVADARWIVEHVDAAQGRALGAFAVDAADIDASARLAEAAARLLAAPAPTDPGVAAPRIAVVESVDVAGDAALFTLAARLRAALADEGLVVLDRALTQELAVEQNDAARGFRADGPDSVKLLGLDAYLELSPGSVRLVRVRDGVVLGVRPRTTSASSPPDEVNAIQAWALPLLNRPASSVTDYLPQVEVEALEPFYRGLAHHDAGRFPEAVAEFTRAYELNGRFREAYEWSARCHDALGLGEVADAIRRFLDTEFLENIVAPTGRVAPVDGVAFLGVGGPALAPAMRDALSAAVASRLARRAELGLRLPEALSRLRAEFDWSRLGEAPVLAPREPALFTRRVLVAEASPHDDGLLVEFTLRDSLGLRPPEKKSLRLPLDPALRAGALERFFATWPPARESAPPSDAASSSTTVENIRTKPAELAGRIAATASESAADADRLRLLLADPAHPLAVVRRSATADEPLASFLEHGRREAAIRRLPPDSTARRWLELLRPFEHLDPLGPGPLYSGGKIDARAELVRIAAQPHDGPGIVARYHLLFLDQARRPPAEIAREAEALRSALRAPPDRLLDCASDFDVCLAGLARLARLAFSPRPEDLLELEKFDAPTDPPVFRFTPDGRLACSVTAYAITRRSFGGLDPEEAAANARALLAINGRPSARNSFTRELLATHPRAPALAQFVALLLSRTLRGNAMPSSLSDDWAARRELARAGYDYVLDYSEHTFTGSGDPFALTNANLLAAALLGSLGHHRMREWLPDDAHRLAHARLAAAERAARLRLSFPRLANPNALHVADLTPEAVRRVFDDDLRPSGVWIGSAGPIRDRLLARENGFLDPQKSSLRNFWWWMAERWEADDAFTASERAALLARPLDAILASFSADADDTALRRHFHLGLMLFYGRRDADAERVLELLARLPVDASASRARLALVGNARLRLAQIRQNAGRLPEAFATARRGLALAADNNLPLFTRIGSSKNQEGTLAASLIRLLTELRHDPDSARLPPGVDFVRVPTRNADNPLLTVYYRTPPPSMNSPAPAPPPRVLVLSPVHNLDPLETLSTPGPWTDFADAHGLVLVSPRFHISYGVDRLDHAFTHPRFASAWSGEALLQALDEISRRTPTDASRVFVCGHASGSGFASHFTAWRPDRVAALALAKGNWGLAQQPLPGHAPLSAQTRVPVWIGANPWDNHDVPENQPRHAYVLDYAARLRDAGAQVIVENFPAPTSAPTEDMQNAARAFLARQLSRSP